MGKRELLLAFIFAIFGFVMYQLTAPAGDPNKGWSFGGIVEQIRREVSGQQARVQVARTERIEALPALREIRIERQPSDVVVVGEDRDDIEIELKIDSRAYDDAEAKQTADETKVIVDQAGEVVRLTQFYPRGGRQTVAWSMKIPKRLALRIDEKGGKVVVSHVAAVTFGGAGRGETVITDIPGAVQATQRGSAITISNVGSLKLTTFNTGEAKISGVLGNVTLNIQGGEVRADKIEGSLEVEARNADLRFSELSKAKSPVRFNVVGGELQLDGVQVETRIDGRHVEVRVNQVAAAPLSIYTDEDVIEVTLPSSGVTVDAMVVNGRVNVDKALETAGLKTTEASAPNDNERKETRVAGDVKSAGPLITLRSTRGEIVLRSRN